MANWTELRKSTGAEFLSDSLGKLIVVPFADLSTSLVSGMPAAITDNASHEVIAAPAAGLCLHITSITMVNTHASVATLCTIRNGATGIVQDYLAAVGGKWSMSFPSPLRLTAATALNAICGTTGANVYVSASGFIAP